MRPLNLFCLILTIIAINCSSPEDELSEYVNPFIGVIEEGACMPGPCLPHASVYPSPNTLNADNGGYNYDEPIVGFAQLHTQGNGGLPSYGNFLISPQIGLEIDENKHGSGKQDEIAKCYYYQVLLNRYNILCELAPTHNCAIYKFVFPPSDSSFITIDVARKINGLNGLDSGFVNIDKEENAMYGGGMYKSNWPDKSTRWEMYFYMLFSEVPAEYGIWKGNHITANVDYGHVNHDKLGAYFRYNTETKKTIYAKISVSFKSVDHARSLILSELKDWSMENVKKNARAKWNNKLSKITISASKNEKEIFYTHLFHSFVQPRNRTGNNQWSTHEPFWDDHYTKWDSWKTLFPLMSLLDPGMVADNINSFSARQKHHGYVATAFINGLESAVGQGGNDVDCIIGDAWVKKIPGIDWEAAYKVLKYNADSMRSPYYKEKGYHCLDTVSQYSWRLLSGSATLSFSYNDFCIATVAKGLGKTGDYELYDKRSKNWMNIWNDKASSDGYNGFIMGKYKDGKFDEINPKSGFNKHFYEGTCWEYSYVVPHDMKTMIQKMGGKDMFIKRLIHALDSGYIHFDNEPSFMTLWWFSLPEINRQDLTSKYVKQELLPLFTDISLPGDDDQGAMGSLYVFAKIGFFPISGQNRYYVHGPGYKSLQINLDNGKTFAVHAPDLSEEKIYIKSMKLNGKVLKRTYITHDEILEGGKLELQMSEIND